MTRLTFVVNTISTPSVCDTRRAGTGRVRPSGPPNTAG